MYEHSLRKFKHYPMYPFVDAIIVYEFLHSGETYLFLVRNALCVPSMDRNFVPPFVLIESDLI